MEKLISSNRGIQFVPESYILPPDCRPGNLVDPPCNTIPVIDLGGELGHNRTQLIQQIMNASQEFGFFQEMEKLISTKRDVQFVPESYILLPDHRPEKLVIPFCDTIPVIDLGGQFGHDGTEILQQVMKAIQEFGFFRLINHGVPEKMMHDVMNVAKEFFELPTDDKVQFYSDDFMQSCRLFTSIDYSREKKHYWRDYLRHHCHPLEEHVQFWPQKPIQYREVVGSYSVEVRKLSLWLLDVICEGLGLELQYFGDELSQVHLMAINHYPPCPDPSLTLGLPKHSDPNLITLLMQGDVVGLQVLKDGQWLAVEPIPNAFVVNLGHILQIISNGKLKSADHRVVTNTSMSRTTIASFIIPSRNSHIEPAKALITKYNPPLYRAFVYKDFLPTYIADTHGGEPPLEHYRLKY